MNHYTRKGRWLRIMACPQGDNIRTELFPVTSAEAYDLAPTLPGVVVDDALAEEVSPLSGGN